MWFVHWLLGIAFYLAVGVSVWIEGAGKPVTENQAQAEDPSAIISHNIHRCYTIHRFPHLQHHTLRTLTEDYAQHPPLHPRIRHSA